MSRIRTYVVGRERGCDVRLDDASVSRRHAEIVRLPDGRLHVTDRATTNGTFVRDGSAWRAIRQAFVEPAHSLRFGDCQVVASRLAASFPSDDPPPSGAAAGIGPTGSAGAADDAPDASRGLVRDPETGEILEKPPPRVRRGEAGR